MVDELQAIKDIQQSQKKWRQSLQIIFILGIALGSVLLVLFPTVASGLIMQVVMLLSMISVFGLFFLDWISHFLNKKYFKQEIVHKYIFQYFKSDDLHKAPDLVTELISKRRKDNKLSRSV